MNQQPDNGVSWKERMSRMTSEKATAQRALICEDEGVAVMAIRKALTRAGYEVVGEAVEGRQAIELARDLAPDLVLMDINMPGPVDGIAATREILQNQPVPIIMLTAYSDNAYVDAALDAGACVRAAAGRCSSPGPASQWAAPSHPRWPRRPQAPARPRQRRKGCLYRQCQVPPPSQRTATPA